MTYNSEKNGSKIYSIIQSICMKLNISITNELIEFFSLGNLYVGPGMALGNFVYRFKSSDGLRILFAPYIFENIKQCPHYMIEAQPLVNTKKFKINRKILCLSVSKLRKLQYATPVTMYLILE